MGRRSGRRDYKRGRALLGPHNLREKMACRTMVGGRWGDGWESAMRGVVRGEELMKSEDI